MFLRFLYYLLYKIVIFAAFFSLDVSHDALDLKSVKLELVGGNVLK